MSIPVPSSITVSLLLLCSSFHLFSQSRERFEGSYSLNGGVSGEAVFHYYMERRDTVKHGPFRFETSKREVGNNGRYHAMNLSGTYRRGVMDGSWKYVNQGLLPRKKGSVEGRSILIPANGKEFQLSGSFDEGRADGEWKAIHFRVEDSELKDTLFIARNHYKKGRAAGPFEASNDEVSVKGDMNGKGMLDGEWRIEHDGPGLLEVRAYEKGVLKEHYLIEGGDTLSMNGLDLGDGSEMRDTVTLNTDYLKALYHSHALAEGEKAARIQASNAFLERSLFAFSTFQEQHIWGLPGGNEGVPAPRVLVRTYPYGEEEEAELDSIGELLERNRELIQEHFENPQVNLGRHSYEEVSFNYEVLKRYKESTEDLARVHELLSDPAFLYIDREALRGELIPSISYPDSVEFKFDGEIKRRAYDFSKGIPTDVEELNVVRDELLRVREEMERIGQELDRILEKYKKEDLLAEKEGELVKRRDSLRALYNGEVKGDSLNPYHERLAQRTLSFYEERFERYAELGLERKIEEVEALISCYGEGLKLFHRLKKLPGEVKELDALYTESTWNPIHFTNMDHRVKKDLYTAFEKELIPYLMEDLRSSLECGKVGEKGKNFDVLFQRMKELRSQKTKVLEKKIRRATGTDEVIEVMDLNFHTG